ncbi:E3 ubiquitin-protein ligase TRIM71-like, partial [Saccostrea cucullata]|uniref:E3 ubiquitin-protein ligase TRIM71-like n=1 Tax=Saccostrea cuccullata TaxID=36930 RepID=UPI002ED6B727
MARSQAQDVIRCQYCEDEPAVFHCVPCGDELCPRCKVFHLKSKVPSGHNIVPLSERLHPTNQIKMCEVHVSKAYEACCEDCQVPVCIMCIQEVHGKHAIGKIQDLLEKQKTETENELSKMKTQYKSEIIQRIKDFKNGERDIKAGHQNIRENMKKQAQDFIYHNSAILKEALNESTKDEREKLIEISQYRAEAEKFEENLDQLIEKFETFTESSHPVGLVLYRKKNPDIFKRLKLPDEINFTMPSFTIGQMNKTQNEHQFGQFIRGHIRRLRIGDDSLKVKHPTGSASVKPSTTTVLGRSVKISETKTQKRVLYHVSCRDDRSAYISGNGRGILLIDRWGIELDNINTDRDPSGLAVMQDGSLIYSDQRHKLIYRVSLNKVKTKLINTERDPKGLCCIRSGDILVCMGYKDTAKVVKYSSSGRRIQEFQTGQNGDRLFIYPCFVCENINDDICVSDSSSKVVVLTKSGSLRFTYHGNALARRSKGSFDSRGVATDSLGHIIIADNANKAVHLINQDGDLLSLILTENDGISRPYGISMDTQDNLLLVEQDKACVKVFHYNDRSAYRSGPRSSPGIRLIDRSGTELDNISTDEEPHGLAVMRDGGLIYSDYNNKVIYRVSLNKQTTRLINTESGPGGLCCTSRSDDIL